MLSFILSLSTCPSADNSIQAYSLVRTPISSSDQSSPVNVLLDW